MRRTILIRCVAILGATAILAVANTSVAQFLPHGYHGGGWGAYPYGSSSYNTSRNIASREYAASQQRASQQQARIGTDIRNTMNRDAQARIQSSTAQRQSAKDWWFQQEQRKTAERQQAGRGAPVGLPAAMPVGGALPPSTPRVGGSIDPIDTSSGIRWPTLLRDPQFRQRRERLDKLFGERTAANSGPNSQHTLQILATVDQLKRLLREMAPQLNASEYLAVDEFLDGLAAQAKKPLAEAK